MSKLLKFIAIFLLLTLNFFYCSSSSEKVKEEEKPNVETTEKVEAPTEEKSSYENIDSGTGTTGDVAERDSTTVTPTETPVETPTESQPVVTEEKPSAEDTSGTEEVATTQETAKNEKTEGETIYGTLDEEKLNNINEKIQDLRYPDGKLVKGFKYKDTKLPNKNDFARWMKTSGKVIKEGFDVLPPNYILEITGHADSTGPEQEEGDRKGNIFYSEERAKSVKKELVGMKIPEDRIITKGVGSSSPVAGTDERNESNRRVTFKFIKKGGE